MVEASVDVPPTPVAEPFSSLAELKQAHGDMRQSLARPASDSASEESGETRLAQRGTTIRTFLARATATGAVISDGNQRRAAQGILDYWCTELVSLPGVAIAGDYMPALLAPFDHSRASLEGAEAAPAAKSIGDKPHDLIRLTAAARLWRDSAKQSGYLLWDKATIEQAARFKELDPDIAELVKASETAVRKHTRTRAVLATIAALFVISAIILRWVTVEQQNYQMEKEIAYSNTLADRIKQQLEQATTAAEDLWRRSEELQKKNDQYLTLLRERNIPIPGNDSGNSEIVPSDVAQTIGVDKPGADQGPLTQDGFIWIGSDTAGKANLADLETGVEVMPQDVEPNRKYRVTRNLVFRAAAPTRADYVSGTSLGVVPAETEVTALKKPESPYLRSNGNQYWLSVRVERSLLPIVYVQYTTAAETDAEQFAQKMRDLGYQLPAIENTEFAKGLNEVRYFYENDRQKAEEAAEATTALLKELGYGDASPTTANDFTTYQGARNYPGVIELWLDLPAMKS